MVQPLTGVEQRWLLASSTEWFAPALAEDWARAKVFPNLTKVPDLASLSFHSPRGFFLDYILSSPVPFATLRSIVIGHFRTNSADLGPLARDLSVAFPSPFPEAFDLQTFWATVARFVSSINFPAPPRPGSYFHQSYYVPLSITYDTHAGYGIRAVQDLDGLIPGLWGLLFPLFREDLLLLNEVDGASSRSIVLGDNSLAPALLLGTLAILNSSCSAHATVIPDDDSVPLPRDPVTGRDEFFFYFFFINS